MSAFEKITYGWPGGRRSVILRDVMETPPPAGAAIGLLTGIEVVNHADGCGWHDVAPVGADERRRVVSLDLVKTRTPLVEHPRYGGLVPPDEATP